MDIIGLVIIVIIIIIAIFIAVYSSSQKKLDTKQTLYDGQLAQSTLDVLMQVDTDCGANFEAVIRDCHGPNDLCLPSSCDYIEENGKAIIDMTLGLWNKPYSLRTEQGGTDKVNLVEGCTGLMEKASSGLIFISPIVPPEEVMPEPRNIVVTLDICKV